MVCRECREYLCLGELQGETEGREWLPVPAPSPLCCPREAGSRGVFIAGGIHGRFLWRLLSFGGGGSGEQQHLRSRVE